VKLLDFQFGGILKQFDFPLVPKERKRLRERGFERLGETWRDSERLGEIRRDSERLGETRRDSERLGETWRDSERLRETHREGSERERESLCLYPDSIP
jgi:hypothetical protein